MGNAEIEAFERSARRSRTIKLTVLGLVVTAPLTWVIYKNVAKRQDIARREEAYEASIALTDVDKQRMRVDIPKLRKQVEDAAGAFANVVTPSALDALEDSGNVCRPRIAPGNVVYTLYAAGDAVKPRLLGELSTLDDIGGKLAEGKANKYDLEALERLRRRMGSNELFVVGERTEPLVLSDSYTPGSVTGFAYVYSHAQRRVICFASFAAQNSPAIDIRYTHMAGNLLDEQLKRRQAAQSKLSGDLDDNVRTAIAARLHATL